MKQALDGIKVADFSWIGAGPWTIKYLADHGAQVIHVESATRPDLLRSTPPYKDNIPGLNRSAYFAIYNDNKYGMSLNLNHPQAMTVVKRIVAWADIVAESFGPGRMKKWGLGYEELKQIKPDIIMFISTQQGQTGPHKDQPGFGTQLTSLAGFTQLTGWPDRPPALPYGAYTDSIAPRFGAAAIMAALDYRRRTGKGQYLDLSQYETGCQFLAPLILDYTTSQKIANRMGNRSPYGAPHGAYPCRGGDKWCVIAIFTDKEWESLCQAMGNPPWTKEARFGSSVGRKNNQDELDKLIGGWTINFTAEEIVAKLQAAKVAAGIVETSEEVYLDPQLRHRHYFEELEHPEIGRHSYPRPGFRLSKTPSQIHLPAPCLGEHTEYVCTKILGMPDEEFVDLLNKGVFE